MSEKSSEEYSLGIFENGSIEPPGDRPGASTPCKTIPIGKLKDGEDIHPASNNVVEVFQEVDSTKLSAFATPGESLIEEGMEDKLSKSEGKEIQFSFFHFTGDYPISDLDAKRLVDLADEYSDVITPPLQHDLLRAHLYDEVADIDYDDEDVPNIQNPDLLRIYRIGVERWLKAIESTDKMAMAPVPLLKDDLRFVKDLINDYSQYSEPLQNSSSGLDALSFNFMRSKPTSPTNREKLTELFAHMRRLGYFDAVFKYAINIRHSYVDEPMRRGEDAVFRRRTAEDLILAGMGFDVIGENHWKPQTHPPSDVEMPFRQFEPSSMAYWEVPDLDSDLSQFWPDDDQTGFEMESLLNAPGRDERRRIQRLINAEQMERALSLMREGREKGELEQVLEGREGLNPLQESLEEVSKVYEDPSRQSSVDEF